MQKGISLEWVATILETLCFPNPSFDDDATKSGLNDTYMTQWFVKEFLDEKAPIHFQVQSLVLSLSTIQIERYH